MIIWSKTKNKRRKKERWLIKISIHILLFSIQSFYQSKNNNHISTQQINLIYFNKPENAIWVTKTIEKGGGPSSSSSDWDGWLWDGWLWDGWSWDGWFSLSDESNGSFNISSSSSFFSLWWWLEEEEWWDGELWDDGCLWDGWWLDELVELDVKWAIWEIE